MKINISENIKALEAIEKVFNQSEDPSNIFMCLCAIEVQADDLKRLVDNFKEQYAGYMVKDFIKKEIE